MKKMTIFLNTFCFLVFLTVLSDLHSQTDTPITVRVLAHDAKLIGTSMGGVDITILDFNTGKILASGQTSGGTGDTDLLVLKDKSRYGEISTPESAAFNTTLKLIKPVYVEIQAIFHTAYSGRPIKMSQTQWLIPGKDMTGDGILLEMPGFAMRILHPLPHQSVSLSEEKDARLELFMIMLCGCPIGPGGTWDSEPMEIEALVYKGNVFTGSIPFKNIETDHFTADISSLDPGNYRIFVSAYDPRTKNTGVEQIDVEVKE